MLISNIWLFTGGSQGIKVRCKSRGKNCNQRVDVSTKSDTTQLVYLQENLKRQNFNFDLVIVHSVQL